MVDCCNNKEDADSLIEKLTYKVYHVDKEDVTKLLTIHPRAVPKNFEDILHDHINYDLFDLNQECKYLRYGTYHSFEPEWEPWLI